MSGDRYLIRDQHATYFLTFTVVDWIDLFTRPAYKEIIADALNYCSQHKGWHIHAWVLMSNHMHLIATAVPPFRMSDVIRDFKKFTSKKLVTTVQQIPESRREWLLHKFAYHAQRTGRAEYFKLWRDDNHAIVIDNQDMMLQKMTYIHDNPVRARIVSRAEDYVWSSAAIYAGTSQQNIVRITEV